MKPVLAPLFGAIVLLSLCGCSHLASRTRATGPRVVDEAIRFSLFAPVATRVQVGGDWQGNNWTRGDASAGEIDIGLMRDDNRDGIWELDVILGPGRYHYAFLVDDVTWQVDPGNPEELPGGPSGLVSVLLVFDRSGTLEVR